MSRTKRIITDTSKYTASTIVSQVIGIFTSILMRRYLAPDEMGVWSIFLLILNYAMFAHLGLFTAAEVRIPYLKGKGEVREAQKIRNITFTSAVALCAVTILVCIAVSLFLGSSVSGQIITGIRMISLIICATLFYNLYIGFLRADNNFTLISKATVLNSFLMLVFVVTLVKFYDLTGMYFAVFLSTLFSFLYLAVGTKYRLGLYGKASEVVTLMKIGLPLIATGIVYTFLLSVDKLMIATMLGARDLGFYSIATLALTYTLTIPKSLSIVITPNIQEEYGRTDSKERIISFMKKPSVVLSYLFPPFLGGVYFMLPLLVYYFMPKYVAGIESMRVLLIGCFFISLVPFAQNYIIALNKQLIMVPMTAAITVFTVMANYAFIKMGYGISGAALGTAISYFLYFLVIFYYCLAYCERKAAILRFFIRMCLPFCYALMSIFFIECYRSPAQDILGAVLKFALFILLYIPVFFIADRETKLISHLSVLLRRKEAPSIP